MAARFKTSIGHLPPPVAVEAFASLLGKERLNDPIGEVFPTDEEGTVWVLTGITDRSLIHVRVSSVLNGWSWQNLGTVDERQGKDLAATLWPLTALRSLTVDRVIDTAGRSDGPFEWDTNWVVTLSGGDTVSIPSNDSTNQIGRAHV